MAESLINASEGSTRITAVRLLLGKKATFLAKGDRKTHVIGKDGKSIQIRSSDKQSYQTESKL